jgi:hypothetical protein
MCLRKRRVQSMNTDDLIADAEATEVVYVAVLRDPETWTPVTQCGHVHRTRDAAERCADTWLRRALAEPLHR